MIQAKGSRVPTIKLVCTTKKKLRLVVQSQWYPGVCQVVTAKVRDARCRVGELGKLGGLEDKSNSRRREAEKRSLETPISRDQKPSREDSVEQRASASACYDIGVARGFAHHSD